MSAAVKSGFGKIFFGGKRKDVDMTEGSIFRHLIMFASPLLVGNVFQQLYNTADSVAVFQKGGVKSRISYDEFKAMGMPEKKKLIDYSTGIASIRIKKNYRTLEQVWEIFNTCRNYYNAKKSYRASELYSNMLRKIDFLCRKEKKDLQVEFWKMKKIFPKECCLGFI